MTLSAWLHKYKQLVGRCCRVTTFSALFYMSWQQDITLKCHPFMYDEVECQSNEGGAYLYAFICIMPLLRLLKMLLT